MTNEKEISILSELRSGYSCFDEKEEPFYHALSEGIKALRLIGYLTDRPCSVCKFHGENGCSKWSCVFGKRGSSMINKEAKETLLCLYDAVDDEGVIDLGMWYKGIKEHIKESLSIAIKALEQEPKTGWIPVSERLPENEQEILFSTKTERVHSGKYHDDDSANQWYSHRDKCRAWNNVVSAWMPLPKPYEPQEREE